MKKTKNNKPKIKDIQNSVKDLILHIKVLYYNNDPILKSVDDITMLYNALCDLDEITGMYEVKDSIVKQIKFLLINYSEGKSKFENHMLHTVIFGPPGVGKTSVGSCLAMIWKSLGLIEKSTIKPAPISLSSTISKINNRYMFHDDLNKSGNKQFTLNFHENKRESNVTKPNETKSLNVIPYIKNYTGDYDGIYKKIREESMLNFAVSNILKYVDPKKIYIRALTRQKIESPIKVVSRPDFVGQYVGHTCEKTLRLLTSTLESGKVLFVDEAYSILTSDGDSFGHEALNELNRFMSEHPQLIVIFAGYKEKIENTLFKHQPGFKRRCAWTFEIKNYSGSMLAEIFKKQIKKEQWKYEGTDEDISDFFTENIKMFESFGGDTLRLVFYCKLKYSELKFDFDSSVNLKPKVITFDILERAYHELYCQNTTIQDESFSNQMIYI